MQTVFRNTDKATLFGAEIEVRTDLRFITRNEALEDLSFGVNTTLMSSQTNISEELQNQLNLTNRKRKLQGASDLLFNADATYKFDINPSIESQITVISCRDDDKLDPTEGNSNNGLTTILGEWNTNDLGIFESKLNKNDNASGAELS